MGRLFGGFALGLAGLFAVRAVAPDAFQAANAIFVLLLAATGFSYWRTLRRSWRCPACNVRWQSDDVLASRVWKHCATCGAPLRVGPEPIERERTHRDLPLTDPDDPSLAESFLRRRRRGMIAAGGVMAVGMAAYAWVHAHDLGEMAEQLVLAICVGISVVTAVLGARCPRCKIGVMTGAARHCQRCGWTRPANAGGP